MSYKFDPNIGYDFVPENGSKVLKNYFVKTVLSGYDPDYYSRGCHIYGDYYARVGGTYLVEEYEDGSIEIYAHHQSGCLVRVRSSK